MWRSSISKRIRREKHFISAAEELRSQLQDIVAEKINTEKEVKELNTKVYFFIVCMPFDISLKVFIFGYLFRRILSDYWYIKCLYIIINIENRNNMLDKQKESAVNRACKQNRLQMKFQPVLLPVRQ